MLISIICTNCNLIWDADIVRGYNGHCPQCGASLDEEGEA